MVLIILFFICILIFILFYIKNKEYYQNYKYKYGIIRILGNNLPGVHSDTQTYDNLKFTLENENDFNNCEKIWIINRIIDPILEEKYINILKKFNKKYLVIPYIKSDYEKLKNNNFVNLNELENIKNITNRNYKIFNKLYNHSLYLININGSRNYGLDYGKQKYLYTFILDGSCFFTKEQFNLIDTNLDETNEYLVIPMLRLDKNNINIDINKMEKVEPQLGFKNSSKLKFNEKLPYGIGNKVELLRVIKARGKHNKNPDNKYILNIPDRDKVNVNFQEISSILRLSKGNIKKLSSKNNRANGLLELVKNIN